MRNRSNDLLAGLPRQIVRDLAPQLVPVTLQFGEVLHREGQPMRHVFFPGSCLVSLLAVLQDDQLALEVALVGHDGVVGVALALGAQLSPVRALVQGAGVAMRMSAKHFLAALDAHLPLQRAIHGYAGALMGQVAQTAACNRYHLLEPRLARWLLMTRDRLGSPDFRMTQEFLSTMLGVRRVGVSSAAASFQRQRLIEYTRGHITILDHGGLEAASCTCYGHAGPGASRTVPWRPAPLRSAPQRIR